MATYTAQKFNDTTQIPETITFVAGKVGNRPQSNTMVSYATTAAVEAVTGLTSNLALYAMAADSGMIYVSPIGSTTYKRVGSNSETITATSGAVGLDNDIVFFDTTAGTSTSTLAAGEAGQQITFVMAVDGGDQVLTPASFLNGTTITFDDAGDTATLVSDGTNWYTVGTVTATVA